MSHGVSACGFPCDSRSLSGKPGRPLAGRADQPASGAASLAGTTCQNPGTDELIKDGLGLADQRRGGGGDHTAVRDRPGLLGATAASLGARD